jgi:ATP-binding cassette, subfamily B, bacterial
VRSFIQNIIQALSLVWQSSPWWTVVLLILMALQSILPLVNLFLLKRIVDTASLSFTAKNVPISIQPLFTDLALFGLVLLIIAIVEIGAQLASETQEQLVSDFMEKQVHQKSIALDLAYYDNPEYHNTLHRAQTEVHYRPIAVLKSIIGLLQSCLSLGFLSAIFVFIHWSIGVLLILLIVPTLYIKARYAQKLYQWQIKHTESQRKASYLGSILTYSSFAKEVRLFNIGDFIIQQFQAIRQQLFKERFYILWRNSIASFLIVVFEVGILLLAYTFIAYRTWQGVVTVGALVMYFQAVQRAQAAVQQVVQSIGQLYQNRLFLSHIFDLLKLKPTLIETPNALSLQEPISTITFKNVEFTYPQSQQQALKGISLEMHKGQIVAFVGLNGSGKTTLIKLLCRLYDVTRGSIDINGQNIKHFSPTEIRQRISIIFQDFIQYHFTVADNIYLSDAHRPKNTEALKSAAQKTGAADFIQAFKQGYEQVLGHNFKNGMELSGGQWQKIALSRAFYKNADIIILDEPTSAIDPIAEYEIFNQLRTIATDKLLILITHRLYNLKLADTVFVMKEGEILEHGHHDYLIDKKGLYYQMFEKQMN